MAAAAAWRDAMKALALGIVGFLLLPATAGAAELRSEYTDLSFDQCTAISYDEMGSTWVCPGLRGYPVAVGEGDLRQTVSYGISPLEEKAFMQMLPPFSHVGDKIEWLVDATDPKNLQPVATILRWYTAGEDGTDKGQVLVVTQLKPGATCHIAYVDALANTDANVTARKAAADLAGSFDCENEMPKILGKFTAFEVE
jgi:hypothetical protein